MKKVLFLSLFALLIHSNGTLAKTKIFRIDVSPTMAVFTIEIYSHLGIIDYYVEYGEYSYEWEVYAGRSECEGLLKICVSPSIFKTAILYPLKPETGYLYRIRKHSNINPLGFEAPLYDHEGVFLTPADIAPPSENEGHFVTQELWIRAVINTDDGPIDGVFYKGGENTTDRGDTVIWGYFYADPSDVSWGDRGNPDLYVKIWFDITNRIDVNFFHVSVPNIDVYSGYPYNGSYNKHGTATMDNRYIRHEYWKK